MLTVLRAFVVGLMVISMQACSKSSDDPGTELNPAPVTKTNPIKVYMHYMPWFESKSVSGYWGSHWRMNNKNPEVIGPDGHRQIASHYYPLIGPYDSSDPDVIDYHLLLMKYAGVDGILIDWYGSHKLNDYGTNLSHSNAIIGRLDATGLQFGIVYEEYVAENTAVQADNSPIKAAQQDVAYMASNYWNKASHISVNHSPLLLTFGPRYFKQPTQWDAIFSQTPEKPVFLPLWNTSGYVGTSAGGEFSWVDFSANQAELPKYYGKPKPTNIDYIIGSAFPRFHDYYAEGGAGTSYGYVDFKNGETLRNTLTQTSSAALPFVQLITWNDFGEGTVIEPTAEDEFKCLEIIQTFTGVSYGHDELQLVYDYYNKKVKYKNDAGNLKILAKVFEKLTALKPAEARDLLSNVP